MDPRLRGDDRKRRGDDRKRRGDDRKESGDAPFVIPNEERNPLYSEYG